MATPTLQSKIIAGSHGVSTAPLIEACGLPEIGSELVGKSLRIGDSGIGPYSVSGSAIVVHQEVASDFLDSASVLREALELQAISQGGEPRWAHRIVAHATAAIYGETMLRNHIEEGRSTKWIAAGVGQRLVSQEQELEGLAAEIAEFVESRDGLERCPAGEIRAASRALPLSHPTEVLLTLGGDRRQTVDWRRGTNSYGLSPRPVPWRSQFGSCTASSPSPRAFDAARDLRHDLVLAAVDDLLDDAVESVADAIRAGILDAFDLGADTDVVLTPSGTDAEYVALALAAGIHGSVHALVLAPNEIGSGSSWAAQGRQFSEKSPFADGLDVGATLAGFESLTDGVSTVDVRDETGQLRSPEEVEAEMEAVIDDRDGAILVHAVEGTKTGIRLPRAETLSRWDTRHGDRLITVVDAAQVRVDQSTVTGHVKSGRMVIVTGSKFFGGPPFSGAVLVPKAVTERSRSAGPPGIAAYLSEHDIPGRLAGLRSAASRDTNYGLVLRWAAAMAEVTSFLNASPEIRDEILRRLALGVRNVLESAPHVRIVESPYSRIPSEDDRGLDDLPTIFTFMVIGKDGEALGMEEAKRVHLLLAEDLADEQRFVTDDPSSRQILHQAFHLGQPVLINQAEGNPAGALRVAIGAPTLSQIVFDVSRGKNWRDRLDLELADLQGAINKLARLV
jgi:hypothetical protein